MEMILVLVIMELCSILFYVLGYLLWKKEKISIMHNYHYTKVKETDKKAYTSIMGKSMIVMAIGMTISGIIAFLTDSSISAIPFAIAFVIGIGWMTYGQIKYNHGIF